MAWRCWRFLAFGDDPEQQLGVARVDLDGAKFVQAGVDELPDRVGRRRARGGPGPSPNVYWLHGVDLDGYVWGVKRQAIYQGMQLLSFSAGRNRVTG